VNPVSNVPGPPPVPSLDQISTMGRAVTAVELKFATVNVNPSTTLPADPAVGVMSSATVDVIDQENKIAKRNSSR
jgi:hypothetical protein